MIFSLWHVDCCCPVFPNPTLSCPFTYTYVDTQTSVHRSHLTTPKALKFIHQWPSLNFWRQTWKRGPWRSIGQRIPGSWDQGHDLEELVQAPGGHMGKTLGQIQRGSKDLSWFEAEMTAPEIFSCLLMLPRKQVGKSKFILLPNKKHWICYRFRRFPLR